MLDSKRVIQYLERHCVDGECLANREVKPDMIVVIPCFDEPHIGDTLQALKNAVFDGYVVEVIVVINSGEQTPPDIVEQNRRTFEQLNIEALLWQDCLVLSPVLIEKVRHKHAGVGYARKIGMDLAVWRFNRVGNANGIIVSLDADTLVERNYFEAIYRCFNENPKCYGAIINFAHLVGDESSEFSEAVMHYELHLRYVNQALKYSGFPYVHHTIGSAFAVRVGAYVAHGGMNRKQGGEDFYFLHKLFPHGEFVELNTTTVFPSSRPSHRVPFGTGPQIREYMCSRELLTYNFDAFVVLKRFIAEIPGLYDSCDVTSSPVLYYLRTNDFEKHVDEIRRNSSSKLAFVKRFYAFFDAFKVIKYLNYAHQDFFEKTGIVQEAARLLGELQIPVSDNVTDLLSCYRKIEGK